LIHFYKRLMSVLMKWEDDGVKVDPGCPSKPGSHQPSSPEASSAYLGPKLWEKPIQAKFNEDDFFVMNIDEFLAENNLQLEARAAEDENETKEERSPEPEELTCVSPSRMSSPSHMMSSVSPPRIEETPITRPSIIVSRDTMKPSAPVRTHDFLYKESKRAKLEREKEERRRRREVEIEFAPEDLALATVPGADFDPSERAFDMEELRPQPIIRKRAKQFVSSEKKDGKYWEGRTKNTIAARRSREARRLKENQIALRAAFLEKENVGLRKDVEEANAALARQKMEVAILREKMTRFEAGIYK
jgi:hypothetical protein